MAFFKQLRLLLKHKILLRRRQPVTLLIELFWPAIVFLSILLVRCHFMPTFRQTCYYNAKVLPSSGMVNLLQSHVCNLDNPCLNASQYQEVPSYPNASIHSIVDQVLPLLTNANVTSVISDLPKGIRLIAAIIDTLSIGQVQSLFEDGFPLRSVVRPAGWRRVEAELATLESHLAANPAIDLVDAERPQPASSTTSAASGLQQAVRPYDILVNASLNLMALGLQSDGSNGLHSIRSFRDVICDHTQLGKFLIVQAKSHVRLLSRHLCLLERKDLYRLFDIAQENIDFGQILQQLSIILKSVGLGEHQQHVDNIITMLKTIENANIFRSLSALRNTSWMYDVPKLFNVLRSGDVDPLTLLKVIDDFEPIFNSDDGAMSEQLKQFSEQLQQRQLDYIVQFYNMDDSSLKTALDLAFAKSSPETTADINVSSNSTEIYNFDLDTSDDNDTRFHTIGEDLDMSETSEDVNSNDNRRFDARSSTVQSESLSRKFLPKVLANMDRLIDGIEQFTGTAQWESLLSGFQGLQMVLEMADEGNGSPESGKSKLSSLKIEKFILALPKKMQAFNNFFNSLVPDKFQHLIYPLADLLYRASDAMLQHLSGAFSKALAEDKIYYFDKFAELLLDSLDNGTLPRKCGIIQEAMCNFDRFRQVFVDADGQLERRSDGSDEDASSTDDPSPVYVKASYDTPTLQGIQELGCLFFGRNYTAEEEAAPILTKLFQTLSTLNDTNLIASTLTSSLESSSNGGTSASPDDTSLTNFTTRLLEVYFLAAKSVPNATWETIFTRLSQIWRSSRLIDRLILVSRIFQLSADCFVPPRIVQSPIWRAIYRKQAIANEMLNVLLDEINDSTESEKLRITQISQGSATFEHFLRRLMLPVVPTLIDTAVDTLFYRLPQFVEKMFQFYPNLIHGWPCNRNSLLDVLQISDGVKASQIYALEEFLCQQLRSREGDTGRIVDELVAPVNNQSRISSLIRAIQSKSTEPASVHQHVPALDWIEVASSLSLIKDSGEKILSMDNTLQLFPEVDNLDEKIKQSFDRAHTQLLNFYTQSNVGLFAYLGDIVSPFVIRHLMLNETFSATCDNGVAGTLMAPVYSYKEWRCAFVSFKYASYTVRQLFDILNQVLDNFLQLNQDENSSKTKVLTDTMRANPELANCSLVTKSDSSSLNVSRYLALVDNVPEMMELFLNEALLGNIDKLARTQDRGWHETICASNLNLDIFGPKREVYAELRRSLCGISTDLMPCLPLALPRQWSTTLVHLNATWYQQSPDSLVEAASFTEAYQSFYRFLALFGQFSPRHFNRFMAKFESSNGQAFVKENLRRLNQLSYFRHKRFAYVAQAASRELHKTVFEPAPSGRNRDDRRDLMMALIYMFNELPARLRQRYKLGAIYVKPTTSMSALDQDEVMLNIDLLDSLLDWIDVHLLVASETTLQTIALDADRLLRLFANRPDTVTVWRHFCKSSVSQYFVVDNQISSSATKAKDELCQLDFNAVYGQWHRQAKLYLANYTDLELTSTVLVKAGAFMDLILNDVLYKRLLLKSDDWQPIVAKLNRLVLGSNENSSSSLSIKSNGWIIESIANFLERLLPQSSIELLQHALKRFHCGMETITDEGLNWQLVPSVYYNKTDVMSLYATLNSAFTLGSVGVNTFLDQDKFYNQLQLWAKQGKSGFCQLRNETDFGNVFTLTAGGASNEAVAVLKNVQTLACRPNNRLLFHLNPVSSCYDIHMRAVRPNSLNSDLKTLQIKFGPLFASQHGSHHVEAGSGDEESTDTGVAGKSGVPPLLDIKQWSQFVKWWQQEVSPYPNSGRTLLVMRTFQLVDSLAEEHVIWKAFYRLTFITTEMFAYSLRALQLSEAMYPMKADFKFPFTSNKLSSNQPKHSHKGLSSLLTSTVSNLIFPEVNHFITYATFRQLRWIRDISHFFASHPDILHEELCPTLNSINARKEEGANLTGSVPLLTVDDDFNDLLLLLCHNHPSDWIYTMTFKTDLFNVKASPRPKLMSHRRIRERIGKLTQVLARMLDYNSSKNNRQLGHVVRFMKLKQLESIENVAGTGSILAQTISANAARKTITTAAGSGGYLKSSLRDLLSTGWRSLPTLLTTVDQYICSYRKSDLMLSKLNQTLVNDNNNDFAALFLYQPKAPDMSVVMCDMPRWDFDHAYRYLSEHLDLKNMLQVFAQSDVVNAMDSPSMAGSQRGCVTPLRFLARWVEVGQDIFSQLSTSTFWSELKACRRRHLLSFLAATKSSSNNFLVKNSLRYVRFTNGLLGTVDKFSKDSKGTSWNNVRELWRTFSYFVLNQVPAYVPITDIVRHDVNLPEYLNATLDRISTLSRTRAKQAIRLLTDSLLDINAIAWHNFSNIALREMICKERQEQSGQRLLHLPIIVSRTILNSSSIKAPSSSSSSDESLYETLCQSDSLNTLLDSLMSALDRKTISSRLSEVQRSELSRGDWMTNVFVPEISQLSTEMLASGTLNEMSNRIGLFRASGQQSTAGSSQNGINHLLISFVSMTRAKNFNTLYDMIKHAIDRLTPRFNEDGPVIDSLSRILQGLQSLKELANQGLFRIKYSLSDLLLNVENVKIFLSLNLGIEKAGISQILNASIDLSEFIEHSASLSFGSNVFCNRTLLFDHLKLQLPEAASMREQEMVTNALCTLSVTEDFKLNNPILNQLVIRKLTNNIVSLIMNGLLNKAEIKSTEINKALNAVRASSHAMPHVKTFLNNFSKSTEIFEDEQYSLKQLNWQAVNNGGLKNISLAATSNLIGKIMCGQPSMPALNREIKLLKVKVQQPKVSTAELNAFSSDFCRNGYRQIMAMQGGSVIWNFLKPILVGKILYTPKAAGTEAIMSHMNSTLRFMPRIVQMLHAWSQTLTSLETFYFESDVNNRMGHVKHLVESIFVNGEADGLFDDTDTFNLIERMTRSGNVLAVLKLIGQVAQCVSFDRFVGVESEMELEEVARNLTKSHEFIAGIVFVGDRNNYLKPTLMAKNIEYKIRIDIDFVPSTKSLKARIWEPGPRDSHITDMGYLHGFVQIQEMVDRAIIAYLTQRDTLAIDPQVHLQQQPYLCYDIDKFGNYIRSLAPLLTTMAWIFLIAYLIREHVLERELHLEEVMRVMGLKSGVAWLCWFIIGFTIMAFAAFCGIIILHVGQLIPASDPLLLFLFFMVFNVSLLMFCYMMSTFFRTATIAALSGIVAYLASFLPFMVAITLENEMSFLGKVGTCLSMSTSFCFGMMYMTRFEVQGVGMHWDNLWHSPMQGDTMNVGTAMLMMGVDSIIYFLIAWYVSHVHPAGNNARRYSYAFFLSTSYWKYDFLRSFGFGEEEPLGTEDQDEDRGAQDGVDNISVLIDDNEHAFNIIDPEEIKSLGARFDDLMLNDGTLKTISGTLKARLNLNRQPSESSSTASGMGHIGMELRGLYVIYNERSTKSKHIAVSNLNLTLKEGEITTILGRNGAGKTTAINVLTGQLPPTSGTVNIYGHRIPEDFSRARRLLGYCPQYNTLFDDLTVREHLLFFAELKGLLQTRKQIEKDVDDILRDMGLMSMQSQLARHLSGGLKRRLCVALAFVGGSKLIILDEPTASVDPVARRNIWDLIVQQKRSRTVLLTTHHMDEAEILSDEVAVIHRGKLLCSGSPLLLKSKYGCGYQLTVSKQAVSEQDDNSLDGHDNLSYEREQDDNVGGSLSSRATMSEQKPISDVDRLMAFTKCLIPNASFVVENSGEVILSLPQYDDHEVPHDYATFFRCFDSNIRTLGFGSYGVTSTTLEEVFLTLCNLEESNMPMDEAKLAVARRLLHNIHSKASRNERDKPHRLYDRPESLAASQTSLGNESLPEVELDSGFRLKTRQFYALLSKRCLHMARDWKLLFCTLFLPCLFIAFAMGMTLIKPSFAPDPALPLLPPIYGQSTASFVANFAAQQRHHQHLPFVKNLHQLELELFGGSSFSSANATAVSLSCLAPRENWRTAKCPILNEIRTESGLPEHLLSLRGKAWQRNSRVACKCSECFTDMASFGHRIARPTHTPYGYIYNLTRGVNVNQFLLRTQPEFMDRRWGGWTLHYGKHDHTPSHLRSRVHAQEQEKPIVKVWYDNNGFHVMPSYLSALDNSLLRANLKAVGVANASDYRITTYSHPLHVRSNQLGDQTVMQQAGDAGIAIIILVGFIFIPTSFVFYIVRERLFEEKHLQRTFGVGPCLYWASGLLWDVCILLVAIGFASAIIFFFHLPIYMSRLNLPAVLALLFFFGWAMINLVYLMEKMFSEPSIAFMVLYCLALFIGIYTMVMRMMIDVFKLIEITPTIYQIFEKVAIVFPPYLLLTGIVDIHRNQLFADIFTLFDQDVYVNPFRMDMLGKHFAIFGLQGIAFFMINLAYECGLVGKLQSLLLGGTQSISEIKDTTSKDEDADVAEERRRVLASAGYALEAGDRSNSSSPSASSRHSHSSQSHGSAQSAVSDILRVFNVTKVFESMFGRKQAVKDITFSVPRGECFGLLGVNGAGKTSLFRILTGQVEATSGEASFNGMNIRQALANGCTRHSIGYCPQADALDHFLTPVEHLTIYAHLRGIPAQHVPKFVKNSINRFQLQSHANFPVQALSRGNRRKLCLAIAMLGNPQLILLDEPTSGLDPQSRRYVCQTIQDAIRDRRSILLTSHSMEECDILCSRLAIMVNGQFKCIGSPQYLKHKFGTGYIITLRLSETKSNFNEAIELIRQNFPPSILRAHHHTMLEFNLPTNDISLSQIFQVLQAAQKTLSLKDYSVSQTTLDQVFVSFASQQVNDFDANETNDNKQSKASAKTTVSPGKMLATNLKHETQNLKRHASLLMSCCQGENNKPPETSNQTPSGTAIVSVNNNRPKIVLPKTGAVVDKHHSFAHAKDHDAAVLKPFNYPSQPKRYAAYKTPTGVCSLKRSNYQAHKYVPPPPPPGVTPAPPTSYHYAKPQPSAAYNYDPAGLYSFRPSLTTANLSVSMPCSTLGKTYRSHALPLPSSASAHHRGVSSLSRPHSHHHHLHHQQQLHNQRRKNMDQL